MSQSLGVRRTVSNLSVSAMPPERWYEALARYQQQGAAHVLATVVAVNGSAPRALQAKMVVTGDDFSDTLGGGGLEHDVISTARQMLTGELETDVATTAKKSQKARSEKAKIARRDAVYTKHYPLGAKLAQCCGGSVTVMFECFNITPPLSILVFGGGHVAAALMTILAELPCQVDWVDSRAERFDQYLSAESTIKSTQNVDEPTYRLPKHIRVHIDDEPVDFVRPFIEQGGKRFMLVMTHDHNLDFELVRAALDVLKADDEITFEDSSMLDKNNTELVDNSIKGSSPYIGCISSATKAKRFCDRLLQRGYSESLVKRITMPIGLPIGGKEPMAVAVSIAAQIMQQYHQA